jgi:hypothetical protein
LRKRAVAAMLALLAAGCGGEPAKTPEPPAILLAPAEDPFGDAVRKRVNRATIAAYDAMEPRFGRLSSAPYAIPADQRDALVTAMQRDMPEGWTQVALPDFRADHSQLLAFSAGEALFAMLIVDPGQGTLLPIMILRNDAAKR